jgi:predicted cobalt transporter CbtA
MRRLLKLGALAGLVGGVVLALFLRLVGETAIGDAVALENARDRAHNVVHHDMFSRATQQVGGMLGAAVFGVCAGAVLAVVFALVRHRLAARDDWRRAVTVGLTAFAVVALAPGLKYPANPPSVGDPATITERTLLYLVMIGWSVVAAWAAWRLSLAWRARNRPDHVRLPAVAGLYLALIGLGYALLPGPPDKVDAPATLIWRFRVESLAGQALFWAVTGCLLGALLVRGRASEGRRLNEPARSA